MKVTRDNILAAIKSLNSYAPATWQIRMQMGLKVSTSVRHELYKMKEEGIVEIEQPTTSNCIRWKVVHQSNQ